MKQNFNASEQWAKCLMIRGYQTRPTNQDPHVTFRHVEKLSVWDISQISYPEYALFIFEFV